MIRIEEDRANKTKNFQLQNELHEHRVGPLRAHTRETLLAYMYLRNFPYLVLESRGSKPLSSAAVKNIRRMCKKYGQVEMTVSEWMSGTNLRTGSSGLQSAVNSEVVGSTPTPCTKHARVAQLVRASGP